MKTQKGLCWGKHLLAFFGDLAYEEEEVHNPYDEQRFIEDLIKAKKDWMAAQNFFENVTDPDLIDYAIYDIEAAKRKYMYLLKQAKLNGITWNGLNISEYR
ncbi:MAG TPA: YaaL family protein [Clostridiales bacterium]|nr:YaaL family protein [Clostridiales bacterium]